MENKILDIETPLKEKLSGDKDSRINLIIEKLEQKKDLIDLETLDFLNAIINASTICNDSKNNMDSSPYHYKLNKKLYIEKTYNPKYGDNRICICGDSYEKHFDSWDDMTACGCKYCECDHFIEGTQI